MQEQHTARCFLACWPDASVARRLDELAHELQRQAGGRGIPRRNIHVTLAFLGDLTAAQQDAVAARCPPLPHSYTVTLDRIGFFKHSGIVWAGPRQPDPEFVRFTGDLKDSLRRLGFRLDARPFVPHLTLLRRARRRPRIKLEPMEWTVSEYALAASELTPEGSRYSVLKRWSTIGDVK